MADQQADCCAYPEGAQLTVLDDVTQNICTRRIEKIYPGRHLVFSRLSRTFVPLAYNAVMSPIDLMIISSRRIDLSGSFRKTKGYLLVTEETDQLLLGSELKRTLGKTEFLRRARNTLLVWENNHNMSILETLDL